MMLVGMCIGIISVELTNSTKEINFNQPIAMHSIYNTLSKLR